MGKTTTPLVGILADDLTSAADGAGPFVARGLRAMVEREHPPTSQAEVLSIDMATRSMTKFEAAAQVARLASGMAEYPLLYKTVDSTLRGHIRAELEAAFEASGKAQLVFAPAFPDAGRVTRNGTQFVDGVPVSESRYAKDPVHPSTTSVLADLVPATIRRAILLDAENQAELNAKIAAIPNRHDTLWVGSPGMAIAMSELINPKPQLKLPKIVGRVLIVVGSANSASAEQALAAQLLPNATVISAPAERSNPECVLKSLCTEALETMKSTSALALIATGGDTMAALLDSLGIKKFELCGELEPGFPLAMARNNGRTLLLGMKAGGFGNRDTLAKAVTTLTALKEAS